MIFSSKGIRVFNPPQLFDRWTTMRRPARPRIAPQVNVLLTNSAICLRVSEIKSALAEGVIKREITDRNARIGILQDLVDRMRNGMLERGEELKDIPGCSNGLWSRDTRARTPIPRCTSSMPPWWSR